MISATVAYLCLTLIFTWAAPRLAGRVHPATAVHLIVPAAVAFAAAGLYILGANTLTWAAEHPDVAELGDWSTSQLRLNDPVPHVIAGLSASLLLASSASIVVVAVRRARALAEIRRAVRACGTTEGVVLLDDARPDAFATPGRHGRIVVTSGLMDVLGPAERTALIAHERSHLRHRHAWWILTVDIAVAANPLLRRAARASTHAVERWADEDAAIDVADRRLVARTIARASLLRKRGAEFATTVALSATGGDTPARVRALLGERPRRSSFAAAVLVLMVVAAGVAVLGMERSADAVFDAAQVR
jgi:Zn-dependent protease with chaperone function